jgi:hypothetical protein
MGFLLRCAFWIGLALLFIPIGTVDGEQPSVNPIQTLMAARDAIADIASICDRQPMVCETAAAAFQTVLTRASEGMRLAQQMIDNSASEPDQPAENTPPEAIPAEQRSAIPPR